jgi:hypothetical protein
VRATDRLRCFVDDLDLDEVFACPACLFELAWQIHKGDTPPRQTVAATARVVWPEMAGTLETAVVEARMREVPFAEDALRDLHDRGGRSRVTRSVVLRLAEEMAEAIAERS